MTGGHGWRRLTTTAVALAALLLSGTVAAATAAAATSTVVFHQSPGTATGQVFARDAAVRLSPQRNGGVSVSAGSSTVLALYPPAGEQLEAGRTYATSGRSSVPHGSARLLVSHAGCFEGETTGTVTVLALARAADGTMTSLALDYRTTCPSGTGTVGLLRWQSDVPFTATSATSAVEPPALVGRPVTVPVVLRNEGTSPQRLGSSTLVPVAPATDVGTSRVSVDRCADVDLAPGDSCTVDVVLGADGPREVRATLVAPDGTSGGAVRRLLALKVVELSVPTPTTVALRGEVVVVRGPGTDAQRVERSCDGAPWTVVQESGGEFVDASLRSPATCAFRTRTVVRDAVSDPSEPVVTGPLPVPTGNEGLFTAVTPTRLADTRDGTGVRRGRVGPGESLRVPVLGRGGVPTAGVLAVVLNVTGVAPTAETHLTAFAAGGPVPGTSNLNLARGQVRANQVVVAVGAQGAVDLRNAVGSTDLVVDVQGWYSSVDGPAGYGFSTWGGGSRAIDTRAGGAPPAPGGQIDVFLGQLGSGALHAADVTLTVTDAAGPGHATAWDGSGPAPLASNVNYVGGQTVAAHAVVPIRTDAQGRSWIAVRTSGSAAHVVVDVNGLYGSRLTEGMRFLPVEPRRLLDTRTTADPLSDGETRSVELVGTGAAGAAVVNVTALGAGTSGYLRVSTPPLYSSPSSTSTVNFVPGEVSPVLAVSSVPSAGTTVDVLAHAGSVHVLLDLLGIFY